MPAIFQSQILPKTHNFRYRTPRYRQSNNLHCLMAACQKDTFFPYAHIFHERGLIGKKTIILLSFPRQNPNNGFVSDKPCSLCSSHLSQAVS